MTGFSKRWAKTTYIGARELPSNSIKCGYCRNIIAPGLGYLIEGQLIGDFSDKDMAYIYMCPHCHNPIIYFTETKTTIPGNMYEREIQHLPDSIQALYTECRTCYANQCYTAAQMIARTVLMHIAVELGAEENQTFANYVDYLDTHGYIPPNGRDWVDFIRTSGNIANHQLVIKDKEETEKVISFLSALLYIIYELPNVLHNG